MDGAAKVVGTWWKKGDRALADALRQAARDVSALTSGVVLQPHQKEALVAFTLCRGLKALEHSALLAALRLGNFASAVKQFSFWTTDFTSRPGEASHSPELARRRKLEAQLFLSGTAPQVTRGGDTRKQTHQPTAFSPQLLHASAAGSAPLGGPSDG